MRVWAMIRSRLRSLFFGRDRESELRDELQLHIECESERLQATGLSPGDARLAAVRLFGGVEQIKEDCREARGTLAIEAFMRDLRYAARRLVRDWRFTVAAVVILGLAIGANTAIFSVVNALLFRNEAIADPARLVNIYQNDRVGHPLIVTSYAVYQEMSAYTDLFGGVLASSIPTPVRYQRDDGVHSATAEFATANYLDVLGLRPSRGRWFGNTDVRAEAPPVAVIGHQTWTRAFHADPAVIGRTIRIDGVAVTIVGVGPTGHRGTIDVGVGTDFWLPITTLPRLLPNPATRSAATIYAPLLVKGRLRTGVTVPQARAAMDVLARRLVAEHPEDFRREGEFALGPGVTVVPSTDVRIHPQADAAIAGLASGVLAVVCLVLAIACSNLATLLLVRGAARAREIAVRLALGAQRHHLVRHLLAESLLLSLAGGVAGCVVAAWTIRMLQRVELPLTVDVTLDYRVLVFALLLSIVTGVTFGLAPALKSTRVDLLPTLRDEGVTPIDHRRLTLKNGLIAVQVALSVLLLGTTSIFLQQAAAAKAHRVGYAVDGVALLQMDVRFSEFTDARRRAASDELLRRVNAIPGVQSAMLINGLPMDPTGVPIVVDAAAGSRPSVGATRIEAGPEFFETLRIPLLYGRVFDARDRAETPRVAVITDTMARRYFGAVNAVGRRFRSSNDPNAWVEVVGVVKDTGTGNFEDDTIDPVAPIFYRSYTQSDELPTTIVARTSGQASLLVAAMQRELRRLDVTLPVVTAQTMAQRLESAQAGPLVVASALAALAALGLILASIGLYSVVSFTVARRSKEIGIRMALGAGSQQVVWSIARGVAGLVGAATGIGLFLSILLMLALRASSGSTDIGIGSLSVYRPVIDPVALSAIALVTGLVSVAAAFVPGRRAALMDPLVALRHE
jgi:predicted permease